MKYGKAKGEGQSQCRRCKELGKWNVQWCCFMWTIEGKEGHYCTECKNIIVNGENEDISNEFEPK